MTSEWSGADDNMNYEDYYESDESESDESEEDYNSDSSLNDDGYVYEDIDGFAVDKLFPLIKEKRIRLADVVTRPDLKIEPELRDSINKIDRQFIVPFEESRAPTDRPNRYSIEEMFQILLTNTRDASAAFMAWAVTADQATVDNLINYFKESIEKLYENRLHFNRINISKFLENSHINTYMTYDLCLIVADYYLYEDKDFITYNMANNRMNRHFSNYNHGYPINVIHRIPVHGFCLYSYFTDCVIIEYCNGLPSVGIRFLLDYKTQTHTMVSYTKYDNGKRVFQLLFDNGISQSDAIFDKVWTTYGVLHDDRTGFKIIDSINVACQSNTSQIIPTYHVTRKLLLNNTGICKHLVSRIPSNWRLKQDVFWRNTQLHGWQIYPGSVGYMTHALYAQGHLQIIKSIKFGHNTEHMLIEFDEINNVKNYMVLSTTGLPLIKYTFDNRGYITGLYRRKRNVLKKQPLTDTKWKNHQNKLITTIGRLFYKNTMMMS